MKLLSKWCAKNAQRFHNFILKQLCRSSQPPLSLKTNAAVQLPVTYNYGSAADRKLTKNIYKQLKISTPVVLDGQWTDTRLSKIGRKLINAPFLSSVRSSGDVRFRRGLHIDTGLHVQMLHIHTGRIAVILVPAPVSTLLSYAPKRESLQVIGTDSTLESTARYLRNRDLIYYRVVLEAGQTLIFNPNGCAHQFENHLPADRLTYTALKFLNKFYCHPALKP